MATLTERMLKTGGGVMLADSRIFKDKDVIRTDLPMLNIACSGEIAGGFTPGLTIVAGESKTFKTALSLFCMAAYLREFKDSIGILYDTEFGITPDYISSFGIDPARVIHIPIANIEELKFDFIKKLAELKLGDKAFFMVDSIGQIASKKEIDDATNEKSTADMTRAKAIRSLLRMITVQLAMKELPCFMINHVYVEIGAMYPKTVIPGGTAVTYSANQIFVITKSQEKAGDELAGWRFNLNIYKSRYVREKTRLPIVAMYESGLEKWAGMLELAVDMGYVVKPKNGWYTRPSVDGDKNWREKDTLADEFWEPVFRETDFATAIKRKFKLGIGEANPSDESDVDTESEGE